MKLAVSNIAWPVDADSAAFELLAANGIRAIEVAPTRVWPQWQGMDAGSIRAYRLSLESAGFVISSMQAILFQKPELRLFGSDQDRLALREHLYRCADLAVDLGAYCLVFGAPKNRNRGDLGEEDAFSVAAEFFASVSEYYAARGVCLGFEANPTEYGCDFATESRTAARLVRAVGSDGFRLHLDTACLRLAGESVAQAIEENIDILRHFHVSEPYLGEFSNPTASHAQAARALKESRYDHWVALEMRAAEPPLPALEEATGYVRMTYGAS